MKKKKLITICSVILFLVIVAGVLLRNRFGADQVFSDLPAYSLSSGFGNAWGQITDINKQPIKKSQNSNW